MFDRQTGVLLELPARPEQALDVFHHPFVYAGRASRSEGEPALAACNKLTQAEASDLIASAQQIETVLGC